RIGWSAVHLGAGRLTKNDPINHAVGMMMPVKIGDKIGAGQPLAEIHAADEASWAQAAAELTAAISIVDEPVAPLPRFYGTIESG
ncbi:MAG: pyrimidine-nucleoside phosphorylase, partial [Anaerolineales bacterium]|nr:pyrimidine-nucleoside phosphorylase [Anaerolineales bacterium]